MENVMSFTEMMVANPRPPQDKTPRPKPSLEELTAVKQEAETALAESKTKRNALTAKLVALAKEIEVATERIVEAETARGALIERAVFEDVSAAELAKADRAVVEAKTAEATWKVVHDATKKAQEALQADLETLKVSATNHAKRFWGRIADDLAVELKTAAAETVARLWAASLRSGRAGDYADLLVRSLPQPSVEQVRNAAETLDSKGGKI